ncbi:PAQR family membrane homeostasis protein TrhA [Paenibacillus lutrae]|uniref:Hemolysin III family protein n=1 Tax=Paenibacillus lutrae TaxID=2078573 RepID=A0A7X3FMK8_9BACL|nr:hemolysin III family protein [Paenibacillus lutrae]MVP02388.1 hemolysin III family protein [Paenibacillus lutrae]
MEYSPREEVANAVSHGIGTLLSIAAFVLLLIQATRYGDAWHIVSFSIFGISLIVLYLCSTLVHSAPGGRLKDIFEIMDHSAIYLLIAGSYTPFMLVTLRGALGWTIFGIVWGLAILGIILKIFFVKKFIVLSTICYIGMGWIIVLAIKPLAENLSIGGVAWLVAGGVVYTIGTVFYLWRRIPYHHAIWHSFVIGGSVCHFFAVLQVLPVPH